MFRNILMQSTRGTLPCHGTALSECGEFERVQSISHGGDVAIMNII